MFYCIISVFVLLKRTDHDEHLLNRCIVQYHFTGDEHEVLVRPHGNSKRSESYIRTMPSTLKELTEVASEDTKTSCPCHFFSAWGCCWCLLSRIIAQKRMASQKH